MNNNKCIIAITGFARAGKGTLANNIKQFLSDYNVSNKTYSFANLLKEDLRPLIKEKFNIDSFTQNTEEKEIIRPLLIAYGECMRKKTSGQYWWQKLKLEIDNDFGLGNRAAIIDDLRFWEYLGTDEVDFVRSYKNNFIYVVKRHNIGPAHISEEKNIPKISSIANAEVEWPTLKESLKDSRDYCTKIFEQLYKFYDFDEYFL